MDKKPKRRMTKQRKMILEVVKNTTIHPTADWVYEQVKKEIPNISLGTIYRNLNVLKEMGEIIELNYGSEQSRFDGNSVEHYHFKCLECNKVLDIEIEVERDLEDRVEEVIPGRISNHRCDFFGYCNDCKE